MSNPKIPLLGTGLSGMVGSRFRSIYKDKYSFENLDLSEGVDITQLIQVERVVSSSKAKVIIHLAAFTNVSAAHEQNKDESGLCYQINVTGTENIALAAKKYDKYLIHISTDFVFDGTKEGSYFENDVPHPIEWYGETKYLAEQKVKELLSNYVILRLAYPYQAKPSRPDFLANIITKLQTNTLPPTFTDHIITPTFVDDVAAVFDYCTEHKPLGVYHCVGSSSLSDFEIAQKVKATFELPGEVRPGSLAEYLKANPRPYQKNMQVSNQKLKDDFGINMATFDEGLVTIKNQL